MSHKHTRLALLRTRWSAIGAAVAVTLGAGGLSMAQAAIDSGERPVTISIAAERILDTRTNLGLSGRFADGTPRDLQVTGSVPVASGGSKTVVPADAVGVLVNVTVVAPTHDGFLSLRPQGATGDPTTSNVNFTPGSIEPNAATVDLNGGQIQIWVETSSDSGAADVLIDVVGYTIDHTHDDRYYTEDEVDDLLEPLQNEPAVAFNFDGVGGTTSQAIESVISVTIAAPTAGYIKVDGSLEVTVPSSASGLFAVSASSDGFDATGSAGPLKTFSNSNASSINMLVAEEKVYEVDAGMHTYYLTIEENGASWDDATIAAVFFANSGGTVANAITSTATDVATGSSE